MSSHESEITTISYNYPMTAQIEQVAGRGWMLPGAILSSGYLSVIKPDHLPVYRQLIRPLLRGLEVIELSEPLSDNEGPRILTHGSFGLIDIPDGLSFEGDDTMGFATCVKPSAVELLDDPAAAAASYHARLIEQANAGLSSGSSNLRLASIAIQAF
jgi:hypothetical protein